MLFRGRFIRVPPLLFALSLISFLLFVRKSCDSGAKVLEGEEENRLEAKGISTEEGFSSIFCTSNDPSERVCRIKNLYYDTNRQIFFLVKHPLRSCFVNTTVDDADLRFLDWSSVINHNTFYWNYQVSHSPHLKPTEKIVREKVHLMKRFLPNNLMHILHDDWLGAWYVKSQLFPGRQLYIFFDDYPEGPVQPFQVFYDFLGQNIQHRQLNAGIVRFNDAVVGNSKALTWYQYGFKTPQGPLLHNAITSNGHLIRQAAIEFLKKLESLQVESIDVALFSRTKNRKILNEGELVARLISRGLKVKLLRLEEIKVEEIVKQLSVSRCVLGMHGSLFSFIPWLPKNTTVIEVFPFAVPAASYTPYKTLSHLLQLKYFAIEITDKKQTREYPDRPPLLGGIRHLEPGKQNEIMSNTAVPPHLCCQDANWLFRIYQDTIVDIDLLEKIISHNLK